MEVANRMGLLFSDVEGSTSLVQRHGLRYVDALHAHRALLRECWTRFDGLEQGTEGDSFFVTFDDPGAAVEAARSAQEALKGGTLPHGLELRVRIGVHVGDVWLVGGEPAGVVVHEAARIAAAAHGEQVLASVDMAEEAPGAWIDLGEHWLKDIVRPLHLMQLDVGGDGRRFAEPRASAAPRRGWPDLPVPNAPLVGREAATDALRSAVGTSRLVTLVGPGGAGKTRLALTVGAALADDGEGPVAWCDLAPIAAGASSMGVAAAVAASVGREATGLGALGDVGDGVLVLDNCEHVVDVAADAVATLLRGCPGLRILATSREPLRLDGERVVAVPELEADEAAALYAQRGGDPAMAEQLLALSDGMPLAIELAASHSGRLSADASTRRLDLLADRRRNVPERHRTIEAAIAGSYDELDADLATVLQAASTFAGWFDADELAEITTGDPDEAEDALALLAERSLVVVRRGDRLEHRLLQTVRRFVERRAAAAGNRDRFAEGHARLVARRMWAEARWSAERVRAEVEPAVRWAAEGDRKLAIRCLGRPGRLGVALGPVVEASLASIALGSTFEDGVPDPERGPSPVLLASAVRLLAPAVPRPPVDVARERYALLEQVWDRLAGCEETDAPLLRFQIASDLKDAASGFRDLDAFDVWSEEMAAAAADLPDATPERVATTRQRANLYKAAMRGEWQDVQRIVAELEALGDHGGPISLWAGWAAYRLGDLSLAIRRFDQCLEDFAAEGITNPRGMEMLLLCLRETGSPRAAAMSEVRVARTGGGRATPRDHCAALMGDSDLLGQLGRPEDAHRQAIRAVSIARTFDGDATLADALMLASTAALDLGRRGEARRLQGEAIAAADPRLGPSAYNDTAPSVLVIGLTAAVCDDTLHRADRATIARWAEHFVATWSPPARRENLDALTAAVAALEAEEPAFDGWEEAAARAVRLARRDIALLARGDPDGAPSGLD